MWKTYRNRYLLSLKVIISLNSKFTTDRIFFFFTGQKDISGSSSRQGDRETEKGCF